GPSPLHPRLHFLRRHPGSLRRNHLPRRLESRNLSAQPCFPKLTPVRQHHLHPRQSPHHRSPFLSSLPSPLSPLLASFSAFNSPSTPTQLPKSRTPCTQAAS